MSGQLANQRIDALVRDGDFRAAAALCEERGLLARAQDLYEKLFDYVRAGQVAEAQGDHIAAIDLFLKGNHLEEAESVRRRLMAELSPDIYEAMRLFEQRSYFLQAAELAESIGSFQRAADLYLQGSSYVKAGKLYERIGNIKEAGEAYETHLRGAKTDPVSNLGLGRVLQRFGRHSEAIPLFSRALNHVKTADEAGRRIGYAFFKLGYLEAGRTALAKVGLPRNIDPERFIRPFEAEHLHGEAQDGGALQGRYRIDRPLPDRVGVCYLGQDLLRDRAVVLRFVPGAAEENRDYFDELARITAPALPGADRILEVDREASFVAAEWVDARPLLSLYDGPAPPNAARCRAIALQIFDTVQMAHQRGILHGSLNPRAVMVSSGDVCRVTDWALHHIERKMATQTGGPESPFAYRAPELNIGREGDFTSDLYSIAAILTRGLTGAPPRMGDVASALEGWPPTFVAFFERAMASSPEARFPSHALYRRALEALPWHEVAKRTITPAQAAQEEDLAVAGPRFVVVDDDRDDLEGAILDARDALLGRDVRLLRLPEGDPPIALMERLHLLSSPECSAFQDVLRSDLEARAVVLEALGGVPLSSYLETRGPLPHRLVLDAGESLLRAMASVHAGGVVLGSLAPELVRFDGQTLRVSLEQALGAAGEDLESDVVGFFGLLYACLSGRTLPGITPERLLHLMRARGFISPEDLDTLTERLPANRGAMPAYTDWFDDLSRFCEIHTTRCAIFARLQAMASTDRVVNPEERAFLDARRAALGLD